jgi:adenylate kinase
MEYYKKTSPLIGYYYAKGILSSVNGLLDIDIVEKNIIKILEN